MVCLSSDLCARAHPPARTKPRHEDVAVAHVRRAKKVRGRACFTGRLFSCVSLSLGMTDVRHDVEAPARRKEERDNADDGHAGPPAVEEKETSSASSSQSHIGNLAALTDPDQKRRVENSRFLRSLHRFSERLSKYNIEGIGIAPLRREQRTSKQWWSPGLLWFSANVNGG